MFSSSKEKAPLTPQVPKRLEFWASLSREERQWMQNARDNWMLIQACLMAKARGQDDLPLIQTGLAVLNNWQKENEKGKRPATAADYAEEAKKQGFVKTALDLFNTDPNVFSELTTAEGRNLFHLMAEIPLKEEDEEKEDAEKFLKEIVAKGVSLETLDEEKDSPLHLALRRENVFFFQFLVGLNQLDIIPRDIFNKAWTQEVTKKRLLQQASGLQGKNSSQKSTAVSSPLEKAVKPLMRKLFCSKEEAKVVKPAQPSPAVSPGKAMST